MKLKKYILFMMTIMCFSFSSYAFANDVNTPNINIGTIETQGEGFVNVVPDSANITLSVENSNADATVASSENAKIMEKIKNKLLSMSITKDKIQTARYNIYPEYNNDKKPSQITSYRVENSIVVNVDDLNKIGAVIDAAIQNGANNVENLIFKSTKNDLYRDQVLKLAAKDAQNKADIMASAFGKKVVGIKSINIYNTLSSSTASPRMTALHKAQDFANATPIESGEIKLKANVNVAFYIS